MTTPAQIAANRRNSLRSKGPGPEHTGRTRFNGLKHGLRAEQVVLPGESREEFDAELKAWFDDWKPATHTRAVLVERAALATWRLRRAARGEKARLYEVAADVAHDFEMSRREVVDGPLHLLPRDPQAALARFRSDVRGLDCLIGLWDGLADAAESGWTSRGDHHDRLLNLLGHPAGSDPEGLEVARASLALLAAHDAGAAAAVRGFCLERSAELRRERSGYWEPEAYRNHLIDLAVAPTTKEAQLMHRYEMEHEKSLRSAMRQLLALEKSGADLPDAPEPDPGPPATSEAVSEAVAAAPAGPASPEKSSVTTEVSKGSGKLASVGAAAPSGERPVTSAGSPGRRRGPIGADPGPGTSPDRR